jgi:hypothetical protein
VSNQRSLRFLLVLLFAAFSSAALVLADASALGQNSNSSTTTEDSAQNDNANMTVRPRRGRGRRGRGRTAPAAQPTADPSTEMQVVAPAAAGQTAVAQEDDSRGDLSGERVDLSGTYTGTLSTAGGLDVGGGPATLTITGTTFTLSTEGGATHNGRVYAVLTRGATSAAFYFADINDPATSTAAVYNVRARKSGDRLTLTPAPQTNAKLTFTPARSRR